MLEGLIKYRSALEKEKKKRKKIHSAAPKGTLSTLSVSHAEHTPEDEENENLVKNEDERKKSNFQII